MLIFAVPNRNSPKANPQIFCSMLKDTNKIFFGTEGLTQTSANYVANLAKEKVKALQTKLGGLCITDTFVSLIGSRESTQSVVGSTTEDLQGIAPMLEKVAKHHELIAWLREAIKAKEEESTSADKYSVNDYAKEQGYESVDAMLNDMGFTIPARPVMQPAVTTDELVAQMSLKERNHVYSLEAEAAVIGKFIHPTDTTLRDGGKNLSYAREQLMLKMANPSTTSGSGRDMVVTRYIPSVSIGEVDALFLNLQSRHREIQAELNGIAHSLDVRISEDFLSKQNAYNEELRKYNFAATKRNAKRDEIEAAADTRKAQLKKDVQHLKIVIPNDLTEVYKEVTSK